MSLSSYEQWAWSELVDSYYADPIDMAADDFHSLAGQFATYELGSKDNLDWSNSELAAHIADKYQLGPDEIMKAMQIAESRIF